MIVRDLARTVRDQWLVIVAAVVVVCAAAGCSTICTADVMGIAFASAAGGWVTANASDAPASTTAEPSATSNPVTAQKVTRDSHEHRTCFIFAPSAVLNCG